MVPLLEFEKGECQRVWLWRYACFKNMPFFLGSYVMRLYAMCITRKYLKYHDYAPLKRPVNHKNKWYPEISRNIPFVTDMQSIRRNTRQNIYLSLKQSHLKAGKELDVSVQCAVPKELSMASVV